MTWERNNKPEVGVQHLNSPEPDHPNFNFADLCTALGSVGLDCKDFPELADEIYNDTAGTHTLYWADNDAA